MLLFLYHYRSTIELSSAKSKLSELQVELQERKDFEAALAGFMEENKVLRGKLAAAKSAAAAAGAAAKASAAPAEAIMAEAPKLQEKKVEDSNSQAHLQDVSGKTGAWAGPKDKLEATEVKAKKAESKHSKGLWVIGGGKVDVQPVLRQIEVSERTKALRILAFKDNMEESTRKAGKGSTMGELVFYNTFLRGLQALGLDYDFAGSPQEFERLYNSARKNAAPKLAGTLRGSRSGAAVGDYDLYVTDTFSIEPIKKFILEEKCKFRIIDYWGTPPRQNHLNFDLLQFLTPFNFQNPPNHHIGYIVNKLELEPGSVKKKQGLVWYVCVVSIWNALQLTSLSLSLSLSLCLHLFLSGERNRTISKQTGQYYERSQRPFRWS